MIPDTRCGAALSMHPSPAEAVGECAGEVLEALDGDRPDLLVCIASPHYAGVLDDVSGGLRKLVEPDTLVGGIFAGAVGGTADLAGGPALSVLAVALGGGHATPVLLESRREDDGTTITGWPDDVAARGTLLLFSGGATFPVEDFLALVNGGIPGLEVTGGLAREGVLVLDDRVLAGGAVGVLLDPTVNVRTLVAQGCRPVGQPFTVTRSAGSRILELAGRPALERLREVAAAVGGRGPDADDDIMRGALQLGVVVDEHKLDFRRGDFVVRGLREIGRSEGSLTLDAPVAVGRTVQFQVRDGASADDDLRSVLSGVAGGADGALLLTGTDRDVSAVEAASGLLPLAGAVCSSVIGPVGGRSEMHVHSASVVLFG